MVGVAHVRFSLRPRALKILTSGRAQILIFEVSDVTLQRFPCQIDISRYNAKRR
jgi:hypothetical protein